jgi:hypothetical protein
MNEVLAKSLGELGTNFQVDADDFPNSMVKRVGKLRSIPLQELEPDDVRFLITQNVGLTFLVPLAIEKLKFNPMLQTLYYPGDMLLTLTKVDAAFWDSNGSIKEGFVALLKAAKEYVEGYKDIENSTKKMVVKGLTLFLEKYAR